MRAKGYKCSNVKCDRCAWHSMCGELGDAALNCVDRIITIQTNADSIRSMSDEELAQMLATGKGTFTCLKCMEFIDGECSMKCDERCLEWLQQPAE